MSAAKKVWDDAAVKDLVFAIIMSTNEGGNVQLAANWDKVTETMSGWGYSFTKSAMSQQWSKKIVKEFKERHANGEGGPQTPIKATPNKATTSMATPSKAAPRKRATPGTKTPGTGRGKKRAAEDEPHSPNNGYMAEPIAQMKAPRSAAKKSKKEENGEAKAEAKAEAMEVDDSFIDEEEVLEAEAEVKGAKEDIDYAF